MKTSIRKVASLGGVVAAAAALFVVGAPVASAANSDGCTGGGFRVVGFTPARTINPPGTTNIPAANVSGSFQVVGRYVEFTVQTSNFAVENYVFTGAPNPLDMTGGRRTTVWAYRTPDLRGARLTNGVSISISGEGIELTRTGAGVSMKIQAQDCASGGIFQMEPQRSDGQVTRITHTLAGGMFYFDNPNFRAREGDTVPYKDTTVVVPSRINIANDVSARMVARDSPQVATRVNSPSCSNQIRKRDGTFATVQHCGMVSIWDVSSGGRMGFVTGEDSTEVAPPSSVCTHQCRAQDRVRGRSTVLGFPFPVPAASRLQPAAPTATLAAR